MGELAPAIDAVLAAGTIPAFSTGIWGLSMGIALKDLNICGDEGCEGAFDLQIDPNPPNQLAIRLTFNRLKATGKATLKLGFGTSFDIDVNGISGLSANVQLNIDDTGTIRTRLDSDDVSVNLELICFEDLFDICVQMDENER